MSKKKKEKPAKKKLPRQRQLPGVGDTKIAAIENLAMDYAELRDQRLELNVQEVALKKKLVDLMHKKKLKNYKRDGITIALTIEKEGIKVRVKSEKDLEEVPSPDQPELAVETDEDEPENDAAPDVFEEEESEEEPEEA